MSATLTIFDIDGTLFKTKAKAIIIKDGIPIKELTGEEIQSYQLKDGEKYDWSQFKSADYFYKTSVPIVHTINLAKKLIDQKKREPNDKIIMITARPDLDDKDKFLATFRKYGLDTNQMYVERAGNYGSTSKQGIVATRKVRIIQRHLSYGTFNLVQMFEDSKINLREFIRFSNSYPQITFLAYFINAAGLIVPFK